MTQENAAQRLYNRFRDAGMTDAGALGVLCNLLPESALRSNNVEDRSGIPDDLYTGMVDAGGYDFATTTANTTATAWPSGRCLRERPRC